jgi:hypothetical protein
MGISFDWKLREESGSVHRFEIGAELEKLCEKETIKSSSLSVFGIFRLKNVKIP